MLRKLYTSSRLFSTIKQLGVSTVSENKSFHAVATLQSNKQTIQVDSPLETLLASLASCETSTAFFHAKAMKMPLNSINFQMKTTYDTTGFVKALPENQFGDVDIVAKVNTSASDEQIHELHEKVKVHCPVYRMLSKAGLKINSKWVKA